MLAAYRPPDSASRGKLLLLLFILIYNLNSDLNINLGLRTSFDPTIHNNPKYETPPDCSNFIPSSSKTINLYTTARYSNFFLSIYRVIRR